MPKGFSKEKKQKGIDLINRPKPVLGRPRKYPKKETPPVVPDKRNLITPSGKMGLDEFSPEEVKTKLLSKDYRLRHFYKIVNKDRRIVNFAPNNVQQHFLANRSNKNVICKSRQLGMTTLSCIDMLDDVMFNRNFEALLISYDMESAYDLFENKISFAFQNHPLSHLYETDSERQNKLRLGFKERPDGSSDSYSSISVRTSGRSSTLNRVHISEMGRIATHDPAKAQEILSGTFPAVPIGGRIDIESTAASDNDLFADMFWEAWNRQESANYMPRPTDFKAHFYSWQWDVGEIAKIKQVDAQLPKEFRDYQKKHNERCKTNPKLKPINDIEITFFFYKWIEVQKSWNTLFSNFPTTPEEAFVSSGSKLFDAKALDKYLDLIPDIGGGSTSSGTGWTYYKEPNRTHTYAIGADPSEGVGRDSSAAVIMDFTTTVPEVVATCANDSIPPDMFAYELKSAGLYYGTALIAVERNNHGFATLTKLKDIYPIGQIFKEEKMGYEEERQTERLGWHTNLVSKPKLLYDLSTAIQEMLITIPSKAIIYEMRKYNRDDLQVIRAADLGTRHFDLLMALAIVFQMRTQLVFSRESVRTYVPRREETEDVYAGI